MNLNQADYKLLSYLYHHNRESITKIAKATKLTREQVDYKIKKYSSSGLIRGFFMFPDWSKFGYNYLATIFLKFEKAASITPFTKKLLQSKNCMSYGKVYGKYDLFANVIFKDEAQVAHYLTELASDPEDKLANYFILNPYLSELYPLKFVKHKDRSTYTFIPQKKLPRKFDGKELAILKILANNARTKLVDIANKLNISIELTHHKIKKLQKDQVTLGSRIQFNMAQFGYYFTVLLINFHSFTKTNQEKIKQFAKNSSHITACNLMLTNPNCALNLFHKEESELRRTIDDLKHTFKNEPLDIEVIPLGEDEINIRTLPFLD